MPSHHLVLLGLHRHNSIPITPALMADLIGIQVESVIARFASRLGLAPGAQASGLAHTGPVHAQGLQGLQGLPVHRAYRAYR